MTPCSHAIGGGLAGLAPRGVGPSPPRPLIISCPPHAWLPARSDRAAQGGNLGSVINTKCFFASDDIRTDAAFIYMGFAICATAPVALFLYFPEEGGGLAGRGGWGSFDPQLIKPPAGYRGADSMDYSAAATTLAAAGAKPTEMI